MKPIYLDHAATTPLLPGVLEEMLPFLTEDFGNPSSSHRFGKRAEKAVRTAAERIAAALHTNPENVIFTAGGSMSNNLAVMSGVKSLPPDAKLFTTPIEHSSLLAPMNLYADRCTFGQVDAGGYLLSLPSADTGFASVQYASNELGTVQNMEKIAAYCRKNRILLHSDCVQAFGQLPLDLSKESPDWISLSAHKFGGPKGIGALVCKDPRRLTPLIYGNNKNSPVAGTLNTAAIAGMGLAAELTAKNLATTIAHKQFLKNLLKDRLLAGNPHIRILTPDRPEDRTLPGILSVCFPGVDSEGLLTALDCKGIAASAGSACHAGEHTPSHVLRAISLPGELQHSVIRFSIGVENTEEEILCAADTACFLADRLRLLSL